MTKLTPEQAGLFYMDKKDQPFFTNLVQSMSNDAIIAMELIADNAVETFRDLMGPTEVSRAVAEAPNSLRAKFGTSAEKNAIHGSDSGKSQ